MMMTTITRVLAILLLAALAEAAEVPCVSLLANAPVLYPNGNAGVAAGDFDGDGLQDVIASGPELTIRYGGRLGTLGGAVQLAPRAEQHLVADMNRDGLEDVVFVYHDWYFHTTARIFLVLATGPRSYAPPVQLDEVRAYATLRGVADVLGDATPDVLLQSASYAFATYKDGERWTTRSLVVPSYYGQAAADLDRDGDVDLITQTGSQGGAGIFLRDGNRDGFFTLAHTLDTGSVAAILTADLNGDGETDVITLGATLRVFLGPITAGEAPASAIVLAKMPRAGVLADFDGNGTLDVGAVVPDDRFLVFANDGTGQLTQIADSLIRANGPGDAADMNGDGAVDLVLVSRGAAVVLGNGDGTFRTERRLEEPAPAAGPPFAAADLDGDGLDELITTRGFVATLSPRGGAQYVSLRDPVRPREVPVAIGDVHASAGLEVVTADGTMLFVHARIGGVWREVASWATNGKVQAAAVAEGRLVFIAGQRLWIIRDGVIVPTAYQFDESTRDAIHAADFNGDGHDDLVVSLSGGDVDYLVAPVAYENGSVLVLLADGKGGFGAPRRVFGGHGIDNVASGDMNGDAHRDLVVAVETYTSEESSENYLGVYFLAGLGDGAFAAETLVSRTPFAGLDARDVDRDGFDDLVINGRNGVELLRGSAGGPLPHMRWNAGGNTSAWFIPARVAIARMQHGMSVITDGASGLRAIDLTCVTRARTVRH